jgi:hypothetical protein
MIDFSTLKALTIPEGEVTKIEDAIGNVMWSAVKKVKLTVKTVFGGMDGDTASITIRSSTPFAPDPSNPSHTTTSWTVQVSDEPDCTIEITEGSTIECTVSRNKGNADSHISLNGTRVLTGEGTHIYIVRRNVVVIIEDKYSQGDYGIITIVES